MPNFIYPVSRELRQIGPEKVARLVAQRLGLQIMPIRLVNAAMVEWEQRDNYRGLQQLRGLDGSPSHVKRVGTNRFITEPGVFGEFQTIGESELSRRAGSVVGDVAVDVADMVLAAQDQLISRELDLIEYIIWKLLVTGTFSLATPGGGVVYTDTFTLQTSAGSDWSTVASATPIADFRAVKLLARGKGINFGASAQAVMNQVTANRMLGNTNAADLGGRRIENGATVNDLANINRILAANDLPQVSIYDEGYLDDDNNFQLYVPDDKVVVVGNRTSGEQVGEYQIVRNTNNPGFAPGPYDLIRDRTGNGPDGQRQVPANIEVHRGHSGGPALFFPSAICVMSV